MGNAKAPRFEAYITRRHFGDRSVLSWPKNQWDAISAQPEEIVPVDVSETPMRSVAYHATVLACEVTKYTSSQGKIEIYREDLTDGTSPINKDEYSVWPGDSFTKLTNLEQIALACGTSADTNLIKYLDENIFAVKEKPGNDHWLSELPQSVVMRKKKEVIQQNGRGK